MYGEDADTAIRIGVGPCVGDGGVVDRQELQHTLSGLCHKVDHHLKVAEVAYACTCHATERENRYKCTSKSSIPHLKERLIKTVHHCLTVLDLGHGDDAVASALPHHHQSRTILYN